MSAFAFETIARVQREALGLVASVGICLLVVWLGTAAARVL